MSDSNYERIFQAQLEKEPEMIPFEREYQFLPKRKFKFDFANEEYKIAVEIEGGTQFRPIKINGKWFIPVRGHNSTEGIKRDLEKYNLAALAGWRVFRFSGEDVTNGNALFFVDKAVQILRKEGEVKEYDDSEPIN